MEKPRILVIATNYMSLDIASNNRTNFLPQFLHDNGYDVTFITSNFNHHKKEFIVSSEERDYKTIIIKERGYDKNVSIKRILSIIVFKRNLKKYFKTTNKGDFDAVIVFVPPQNVSSLVIKTAKKNNWKVILDVRDLWPEAYKLVVKNNLLYNFFFWPLILQANRNYKNADYVIAVSETYRSRARPKKNDSDVIYLGTSFSLVDKILNNNKQMKPSEEIWVTYAGTIGNSYKLENLIKAYRKVLDKGYNHIMLLLIGSGPLKDNLVKLDEKLGTKVMFFERLPYNKMIEFLQLSDIAINSLAKEAPQSIINKHMDYSAVGLPVINTQELPEYRDLVEKHKIGKNIDGDNLEEYANAIIELSSNANLRKEFGNNHRKLGEKLFDRDHIYNRIISILDSLIEK